MGKGEVVKHNGKTQQSNKGVSIYENGHIPSTNVYLIMTDGDLANEAEQGQDLRCGKTEHGSSVGGIQERIVQSHNVEHRTVQEGKTEQGEDVHDFLETAKPSYQVQNEYLQLEEDATEQVKPIYLVMDEYLILQEDDIQQGHTLQDENIQGYNVQKGTIQEVSNIECADIEEMKMTRCGDYEQGANTEENAIKDKFNENVLPQSRGNSTKQQAKLRNKIIISTVFAVIVTLCILAVPSVYLVNMNTQQGGLSKYIPLWWFLKERLSHINRFANK